MDLDQLRISDLRIIEQLPSATSIRELARQQKIDPQNLTKRIRQIEELFGFKLIDRSTQGITLNSKGEEMAHVISESLKQLNHFIGVGNDERETRLRTCGRGFMVDYFLYSSYGDILDKFPKLKFDFMDLSPELTERAARQGLLDIVFSFDDVVLGDNFAKYHLGTTEWKYVVKLDHPLLSRRRIDSLEGFPIIGFCYIESGRLTSRASPRAKALKAARGSGAENSRYAIRMVASSNAIAYLPTISFAEEAHLKKVKAIHIEGQLPEFRQVYVHCNKDTVQNKVVTSLVTNLQKSLKQLRI